MSTLSRRAFTLSALATLPAVAACSGGVGSTGGAQIDARVDATLAKMYADYPQTRELAAKSSGMLVMPLMTKAGLGFGGAYGRGALRVNGVTVDYYSATAANFGIQIGAQQYAHVLFFMTPQALMDFRRSEGWAANAGATIVFNDQGDMLNASTTTSLSPVIAVVFNQAGLQAGAVIEGMKYTRILP